MVTCNKVICGPNEVCDSGICKCGSLPSCAGKLEGSFCDGSRCKCSAEVDACDSGNECLNGQCGNYQKPKNIRQKSF